MPSWWMKSSSKGAKKKLSKGSFIDTLHQRSKIPSEGKINSRTATCRRRGCTETVPGKGSQCQEESKSALPSKEVSRCQTEKPSAQPLPLPARRAATSRIIPSAKPQSKKGSKSLFLSIPKPVCIRCSRDPCDLDDDLATASVSCGSSIGSEEPADSHQQSPPVIDHDCGSRTAADIPPREQPYTATQLNPEVERPTKLLSNHHISHLSPKRRPLHGGVTNLQIPHHGAFFSAPDSSMSSPSRSPMRGFGNEQITSTAFWAGKAFPDVSLLGSGNCSSPGSGCNSVYNSIGGDMPGGPLFWQHSRGSPEYSPILSPRMASPGPNSRVHSGAVTPLHPRAGGSATDLQKIWPDDGNQQSHRLPLPPVTNSNSLVFSHSNSVATSPSVPRSPGRAENLASPDSCWKKGKLLGRGTFGHVYVAFNSGSGEMCAMKEVTLFSDDAKSRESAKQLGQEIALLSRLRHPNIVQYYGSETVGDRLYIFLEYVSGGSIYKLLQDYGKFSELVIRIYTQQILSGLAYLHAKNTVHRDIKGANILVDPNGRVKLADFGMAKHITGQSCPLSFKGSPYWMAPEVIQNSTGSNLAVDIWSLGCTVLEMATSKPPWSQFEGVAAMFKIGNSKELPVIPDNLSDEGKDFLRQCLQRNPRDRPSAAQLLEHPFVKDISHLEKTLTGSEALVASPGGTNGGASMGVRLARNVSSLESCGLAIHSIGVSKSGPVASGVHTRRYISCPVSPIRSPRLHSRLPPNPNGRSGYMREELSGSMLRGEKQNGKKPLNGVEPA